MDTDRGTQWAGTTPQDQITPTRLQQDVTTQDSTLDAVADTIRRYPVEAMAGAVVLGMIAAFLIVPRRTTEHRMADISPMTGGLRETAAKAVAPILPAVERVAQAVSEIGGSTGERASDGLGSLWRSMFGRG